MFPILGAYHRMTFCDTHRLGVCCTSTSLPEFCAHSSHVKLAGNYKNERLFLPWRIGRAVTGASVVTTWVSTRIRFLASTF